MTAIWDFNDSLLRGFTPLSLLGIVSTMFKYKNAKKLSVSPVQEFYFQENIEMCISCNDVTESTLKTALNIKF